MHEEIITNGNPNNPIVRTSSNSLIVADDGPSHAKARRLNKREIENKIIFIICINYYHITGRGL